MINQDDDRNLRVQFSQMDKFVILDGGSGPIGVHIPGSIGDRMHLTNYREREIVISPAFGYRGIDNPQSAGHQIRERVEDYALQRYEFNLGDSIFNSVTSTGIGFVPIVGDAIGIATGMSGPLVDYNQIKEIRNTLNHVTDTWRLSDKVNKYNLNIIFISEDGTYTQPELWFSHTRFKSQPWCELPDGRPL